VRSSTLMFNSKAYRETDVVLVPHAVAVEPPELIGTGRAVSKYKPETVVKTVELVSAHFPNVAVITGAEIESEE